MEPFETIIQKGKISDLNAHINVWGIPIFLLLISACCVYGLNFTSRPVLPGQSEYYQSTTDLILTVVCSLMMILSTYQLTRAEKILRLVFYKDVGSNEYKEKVIEKLVFNNKWKLNKSDKNYYRFWENNIFLQSYFITIVFDEKGFYVNSYPYLNRIIDFGLSERRSKEICASIKGIR